MERSFIHNAVYFFAMEAESSFLLNKDIEMGQLRYARFIEALVQHFWVYFCLGTYILILKTTIKVTFNIEYRTFESMQCLS